MIMSLNAQKINPKKRAIEEVTIGEGSVLETYPIQPYASYSYGQSIYLASEIGRAGEITKIAYHYGSDKPITEFDDWTVYMGHTDKAAFLGNADWVPVSSMTKVFEGTISNPDENGWIEITLTTPFNYNGTSNLVIGVDENKEGDALSQSQRFYCTLKNTVRSIVFYDNLNPTVDIDPNTVGAGISENYIPNIKITLGSAGSLDLAATKFMPNIALANENVTPVIKVKNFGETQVTSVKVNVTVNSPAGDKVYDHEKTVATTLNTNDVVEIQMDDILKLTEEGKYKYTAKVVLAEDDEQENNTIDGLLEVPKLEYPKGHIFAYKNFAYEVGGGNGEGSQRHELLDFNQQTDEIKTSMISAVLDLFAGDYSGAKNAIYTVDAKTNELYILNGDGSLYKYGKISNIEEGFKIAGLTINDTKDVIYLSAYKLKVNNLYTLNLKTLEATKVGEITNDGLITTLAVDASDNLYGVDKLNQSLYKINTETAEETKVGSLGLTIKHNCDLAFDRINNILYLALDDKTESSGIYTVDTKTGMASTFVKIKAGFGMCAVVPKKATNVTFSITDAENSSLEGAKIKINSQVITTNSEGKASKLFLPGAYTALITKEGYVDASKEFVVEEGAENMEITQSLETRTYKATFYLNVKKAIENGKFNPATDKLYIDGTFPTWATDLSLTIEMKDDNNDKIYDAVVSNLTNGTFSYKYFKNSLENPIFGEELKSFEIAGKDMVINDKWKPEATGINDNSINAVALYPNPTEGKISIKAIGTNNITITDITGKTILNTTMTNDITLNISNQKAGIYFVKVQNKQNVKTYKIIKK